MRTPLLLLLTVACALTEDGEARRKKIPYIADAVGNTLPPPSNGPATVGSPVNLLTPDRYEFYTFDESGELVKRLMTLEEIQAIVAAGEDGEGLVTFSNENQPTIAFNFSQPPYTKVHSVVTNVQNVLKAQMEAHKNKPHIQPTFDTPDVSDSWSLILPSIFGNTGVDITPEKTGSFTTPETELKEFEQPLENSISKEGSNQIVNDLASTGGLPITERIATTTAIKPSTTSSSTTTTTTTTQKPTSTTTEKPSTTQKPSTTRRVVITTSKPSTVRNKPTTTTTRQSSTTLRLTTSKPTPTVSTTTRPRITTTSRPRTTTTTTTTTTTAKPRTTITTTSSTIAANPSTTASPRTKPVVQTTPTIRTTPKITTIRPYFTTRKRPSSTTQKYNEDNFTRIKIQTVAYTPSTTEKSTSTLKYEKISTFVPFSTATYITDATTRQPVPSPSTFFSSTTKRSVSTIASPPSTTAPKVKPSTVTYQPSTTSYVSTTTVSEEKVNGTTVTTQSVSPSTTATSTEFISTNKNDESRNKPDENVNFNNNESQQSEPEIPLFDVAQSISQIASDLGNYRPLPTSNELLLDTTKITELNPESKENVEMEIPSDSEKISESKDNVTKDNFVKISTIDPHFDKIPEIKDDVTLSENDIPLITTRVEATSGIPTTSTLDTFLSESMGDLLSQVVNQAPQTIIDPEKLLEKDITTTEKNIQTTTEQNRLSTIAETTKDVELTKLPVTFNTITTQVTETKDLISDIQVKSTTTLQSIIDQSTTQANIQPEINEEKSESYVQISISKDDNDTKNLNKQTTTVAPTTEGQKVDDQQIKLDEKQQVITTNSPPIFEDVKNSTTMRAEQKQTENIISTTESLPTLSFIENRFKEENKTNDQTTNPALNKVMSADSNKVGDKNDKDKITDLPKIEDFKKKIQKVNIDEKELANERNSSWKPVPTVPPPRTTEMENDKVKEQQTNNNKDINLDFSKENQGLEITTKDLDEDVAQFTELCNELAFRYWHALIQNIDKKRSFVLSPYSITSMLSMIFMGARGATSGEMNEILKLDDMVTFNPHFTLKNISDSLEMSPESGVLVSAFVRELFSDRNKGKILTFYKERASHFYNGHVEEVNFNLISDIIRRRTNLLVKRYTWGKIMEYMKANTITMQSPFASFSVNVFQTDCSETSVEGRDGEMYFVVSPNVRQRRLVPVPAAVYKEGFLAGYDPVLDATAAAVGGTMVSTLFVMPGQQGNVVHAEDLEELEKRLLESNPITSAWKRLLRTLLPRMGLELQIPRFSHKSIFNVSSTLKQMGLKDLFDPEHADLGGVIGPSKDLYLSDMIQSTTFVTCGGGVIGEQHHIEEYPESLKEIQRRRQARWTTMWEEPRDYQRAFHDPHDLGEAMNLPLHLRPRQARVPARVAQPARLKFDRPFLYFVRHNPTGMILYVGRYNPRLLP